MVQKVMSSVSVTFSHGSLIDELASKYEDKIPTEDFPHFAACLIEGADFLISRNRKFLKRVSGFNFKCVIPERFLKEFR